MIEVGADKGPGCGDSGVVDQHGDPAVVAQALFDASEVRSRRQIGSKDFDSSPRVTDEARGEVVHALLISGDEDEVVAAPRQAVGVGGANARGRSGDQRDAVLLFQVHG